MIRSLAWATCVAVVLGSLTSCRAQEERRNLESTINRLESRLERMDTYVQSLQNGRAKEAAEHGKAATELASEARKLKQLVAAQESELKRSKGEVENAKANLDKLEQVLKHSRAESDKLRQDLATSHSIVRREQARAASEKKALQAEMQAALQNADAKTKSDEESLRMAATAFQRSADERVAATEKAMRDLQARSDAEKAKIMAELEQRNHAEHARQTDMEALIHNLQAELRRAHGSIAEQGNKRERDETAMMRQLVAERREVEQLAAAVQKELKASKARQGVSRERGAELEKRAADLSQRMDVAAQENAALRTRLEHTIREREMKIAELTARLEVTAAKTAAKAAQAIKSARSEPAPVRWLTDGATPTRAIALPARRLPAAAKNVAPTKSKTITVPTPAGNIVINNEGCDSVHIHIHGSGGDSAGSHGKAAPRRVMFDTRLPGPAGPSTPGPAGPAGPSTPGPAGPSTPMFGGRVIDPSGPARMFGLQATPPTKAKAAKPAKPTKPTKPTKKSATKKKDKEKADAKARKKINDAEYLEFETLFAELIGR